MKDNVKMLLNTCSAGVLSLGISICYRNRVFSFSFLGHEEGSQSYYVSLWAKVSFLIGVSLILLGFLAIVNKRALRLSAICIILIISIAMIAIQFPPLFWWTLAGMGRTLFLIIACIHLILFLFAGWVFVVSMDAFQKSFRGDENSEAI
ncbi:hypothetical protein ACFFK0_21735 [Paenibacillus chartarius]|uniref:Uncharacterized protein n=1 Tax=Paenibacillus chartarius TaxID=747481 RepID=A0ABV6DQW0_9BACL